MKRYAQRSRIVFTALSALSSAVACKSGGDGGDAKNALSTHETWCPDGFEVGPNDTCFAIPDKVTKDTPVLVYLHGMYTGHGSPEEWAAVKTAVDRGFATVIPRGKRGHCAWRSELKDHYCWPEDPEDVGMIKGVVAEWDRVLWQVDALLEPGTHKRYVLGSANGGKFASFIATHGLFPGSAYTVVNSGALGGGAPTPKLKPVPILLTGAGEGDGAKSFHEALQKASWPHAFCPRPGASTLTHDDVDAALKFFRHDAEGLLHAQGSAYPCERK